MDEKLSTETGLNKVNGKYWILFGIILVSLLFFAFGMGFVFGRNDMAAPIIIETVEK